MAYLKPQSPIKNGEDNIYPLTTYDQIIMPDGSRWDGSSGGVSSVNGKTGEVTLNASDVGAMPNTYVAPVTSVNGKTGAVSLVASDVGAAAASHTHDSLTDLVKRWNATTMNNMCTNIDNPVKTGLYHCNGETTGTKPSTHGELLHITENPIWSEHQLFFPSSGLIYHRHRNNNGTANSVAWGAWTRVILGTNFSLSGTTLTITTT